MAIRETRSDRVFSVLNIALLTILTLIVLYPLVFVVSASFSNTAALAAGKVVLLPVRPNLSSYRAVFRDSKIWLGYRNTTFYTVLYLALSLTATLVTAYPLSGGTARDATSSWCSTPSPCSFPAASFPRIWSSRTCT